MILDTELCKRVGTDKGAMLSALMSWCYLDRPIPGPAGEWASELPYSGTKANSVLESLIKDGLVTVMSSGYLPVLDEVDRVIAKKRVRRSTTKKKGEDREIIGELEEWFSQLSRIGKPSIGDNMTGAEATVLWWRPLGEMLFHAGGDVDECKKLIKLSIEQLRGAGMNINCPKSLKRTFVSLGAEKGASKPSVW